MSKVIMLCKSLCAGAATSKMASLTGEHGDRPAGVGGGSSLHARSRALPSLAEVARQCSAGQGALLPAAPAAAAARLPGAGLHAGQARALCFWAPDLSNLCACSAKACLMGRIL